MKKIIALLVGMIVGSAVFAEYRGDFQIRPISFGTNSFELTKINDVSVSGSQYKYNDISSYNFGVQTCHTWGGTKSPFKFGFSVGFDFGGLDGDEGKVGDDGVSIDFTVGPAISFKVNKIIKFETAFMLDYIAYAQTDISALGVGFAWDFIAEFFPEAVFSPLFGINYVSGTMTGKYDGDADYDFDCDYNRFKFFIGGAFNFGRHN